MADLFESGPAKPASMQNRPRLHDETDIYMAVADLSKYIARTTSDFRRDIKPTYGVLLVHETSRMSVMVREAAIARGADKVPLYEEILRQLEYIKFSLKTLDDLGQAWLPHKTYSASIPLTESIGRQAHGLKAFFAPAP